MNPRLLMVLNRRLDRVFLDMEIAWTVYKRERENEAALRRYLGTLRRAERLWSLIKPFSKS